MIMQNFLYPQHPVYCVFTWPSNVGINYFLTILILNNITEFENLYIYSTSLHQDLYQKVIISFSNYLPIKTIPNILNREDLDLVFDEIVNDEVFEESDTETETYESIAELKYPQEYEDAGTKILDDSIEKETIDPRVQAMFKRCRHNNLSFSFSSQDYYELQKTTIRTNGNTYEIFKPNNFRGLQKLHQDKTRQVWI